MDLGIRGRTAIVTAASRGIGRACAEALAQEGVNVAISARGEAQLQSTLAAIRKIARGDVMGVAADVTSVEATTQLVNSVVERLGGVDILVVIGGAPRRGTFFEVSEDGLREGFELTVLPVFRLLRLVIPHMQRARWGRVVSVQSRSVREPIPGMTVSNSSRPGAAGLIKQLSQEFAKDGILMNTVLPGRVRTDRYQQGLDIVDSGREAIARQQAEEIPIGRLGEAREIADVVAFLVSERASYVNGATISVDGGLIRSI